MPATERDRRNSDRERHQRRKGHRYNDSTSELLPFSPHHHRRDSESQSPRKERPRKKRYRYPEDETTESSNALSAGALEELDALNVGDVRWNSNGGVKESRRHRTAEEEAERRERMERRERRERRRKERGEGAEDRHRERRKQLRVVSGTYLERGAEPYDKKVIVVDQRARLRGGAGSVESEEDETRRRKRRRIGECCRKERGTCH
jgi:glucan 1,3-beta-glucosidase